MIEMAVARTLGKAAALVAMTWVTAVLAASTEQPRFVEQGHRVDTVSQLGRGNFASADLDGDGIQELVFEGYAGFSPFPNARSIIAVIKREPDGSFDIVENETILQSQVPIARMLAWSQADSTRIIVVGMDGFVREYSGLPLREQRTFSIAESAFSAAIGDVDADGNEELIVVTQDRLYTYALASGVLLRSIAVSGNEEVALAQLDADPALEIILGGASPGLVLDGATHAIDWQHADGFGYHVAAGRFGSGVEEQWVGAKAAFSFTLFGSSPWSALWNGTTTQGIDAIGTAKLDASGRDSILIADANGGSIHVLDGVTQQERLQIPNAGQGVAATTGVDFDGDGLDEIVFGAGYVSGPNHAVAIADGQTGSLRWAFYPNETPYTSTALGDVDGDGRVELVAAARHDYGGNGAISIFDAETGRRKWRSVEGYPPPNYPLAISTSRIGLIPRPATSGMDIVLAGEQYSSGKLLVIDGTTKEVRLAVSGYSGGPLQSRSIRALELLDYDKDGTIDFLLGLQGGSAAGAALTVLSGVDGSVLWTSVAMGNGTRFLSDAFSIGGESPAADTQLIAVMSDGLRSFSASTGLLEWVLPVANDGAAYIPSGADEPEIAVFSRSGHLQFFSAATRTPLRLYKLPSPLHAITLLDDDARLVLAASGEALRLIDGTNGITRVTSGPLAPFAETGGQLTVRSQGNGVWQIASGTQVALYRHLLELQEAIFADGFGDP